MGARMSHFITEAMLYHLANEALKAGLSRSEIAELVGSDIFIKNPSTTSKIYVEKTAPLFRALYEIGYQKNIELISASNLYAADDIHSAYFGNAPDVSTFIKFYTDMCLRHSSTISFEMQVSAGTATLYINSLNKKNGIYSPQRFYVIFIMLLRRIFDLSTVEHKGILSGLSHDHIPDPDNFSRLTNTWFRCKENRDYISFPSSVLELKNKKYNPLVSGFLTKKYNEHYCVADNGDRLLTDIASHITASWEQGDISTNIDVIAEKLGMSRSKLYRELTQKNITFSSILESQRKQYAMAYIKDKSTSIAEISDRLGYANVSAFTRAFNRWYNVNPSKMRQQ
jgi:AraC-like DNA-binding protein